MPTVGYIVGVLLTTCSFTGGTPELTPAQKYLSQRLAPFGLAMHDFEDTGRGVCTLRERSSGTPVFGWSDSEVVLAERVLSRREDIAAAAAHAAREGTPLTDEALLSCYMVCEMQKSTNDWFFLYLTTLPAVQLSAICMNARDRTLLPRCYARCSEASQAYAVSQHAACATALEATGEAAPPLDRFLRAFAHVRARSFELDEQVFHLEPRSPLVTQQNTGGRRALLPLFDLLNHKSGARVRLERSEKSWRVLSDDAFAEGDQVFNSYGERANFQLLLNRGFALKDNKHAVVAFDVADLLDATAAARPHVFGDAGVREELRRRLDAVEASVRVEALQNLALFTFDASEGAVGPSAKLRAALSAFGSMAKQLGCSEEEASTLPDDTLDVLLRARLAEILSGLAEAGQIKASSDDDASDDGGMTNQIVTLLEGERAAIERALEAP